MRITLLLLVVLSIGLFLLFRRAAQQPPLRPVATVNQLHQAMISPSSDVLFNAGTEAPKDDAGWAAVRNGALTLAESGNLLMIGNRVRDTGAWMRLSQELVEAGAAAAQAAESRNVDAVLQAGDQIVVICMNCHEAYRDNGRKMNTR